MARLNLGVVQERRRLRQVDTYRRLVRIGHRVRVRAGVARQRLGELTLSMPQRGDAVCRVSLFRDQSAFP